jgi:DNA-binding transcriptional LysR family regulator
VDSPSTDLDDLALFVEVVRAGGFTAAARVLNLRKAHVSRRVGELERRAGVRLLERTTRAVRMTETGAAVFEHAERAVSAARAALQVADEGRGEPSGTLRLSATPLLSELVLRPVVVPYLARYPQVSVELDVSARPVDLIRENFDVALRVGPAHDSKLVRRVLGAGRSIYVAAPSLLRGQPPVTAPKDLERYGGILISGGPPEWTFQRGRNKVMLRPRVRLSTSSFAEAREAALAGVGVVRLPSFFLAEEIKGGQLRQLLPAWTPPTVKIAAVYPSRSHLAAKTRVFLDMLSQHVAKHPLRTA